MPWQLPPEYIRKRVGAAFGGDEYLRLQSVWEQAMQGLPTIPAYRMEQQWRAKLPEELVGTEGKVDKESMHYLGLARDVGWRTWPLAYKRQVASYLERQGYAVERTSKGKLYRQHLHYGVPKKVAVEKGLIPAIRQVVNVIRSDRLAGVRPPPF